MESQPFGSVYVAFLDILGFKELVQNLPHETLHRIYSQLFVTNARLALANGKYAIAEHEGTRFAVPDLSEAKVACMVVSDSVLMYSRDGSARSFVDICFAVGNLLKMGFFTGLPMRGSISYGTVSVFQEGSRQGFGVNGLVGLPLVNAYLAESAYEWAGCAISRECVTRFESSRSDSETTMEDLSNHGMIARYQAPLKDGGRSDGTGWVVDWPRFNESGVTEDTVRRAFTAHGKDHLDHSSRAKLRNTMAFLSFSNGRKLNQATP